MMRFASFGVLSLAACTASAPVDRAPTRTAPPVVDGVDGSGVDVLQPASGCDDDQAFFVDRAWPEVFGDRCITCHSPRGPAKSTRLVLDRDDVLGSMDAVWNAARLYEHGLPLLLTKPTDTHASGHGGGEVVVTGSSDHAVLVELVDRVSGHCTTTEGPGPGLGVDTAVPEDTAVPVDTGVPVDTDVGGPVGTHDPRVACDDERAFFDTEVVGQILSPRCAACHTAGGAAEDTRLVVPPSGQSTDAFYSAVLSLALEDTAAGPLLLAKPMGRTADGHGGGRQVRVGTLEHERLTTLVQVARGELDCSVDTGDSGDSADTGDLGDTDTVPTDEIADPTCGDAPALPRRLRRLTPHEYDRTVADLLGVPSTYGEHFAADVVVDGYRNNAEALEVGGLLAEQLAAAAESIAFHVSLDLADHLPCDPVEIGERDCASAFLVELGTRAFRRPLALDEHDRYLAFFDEVRVEESWNDSLRWVVAALLQSPGFLYRAELGLQTGDGFQLTDYELASELSYLVWSSMPDDELFELAELGLLHDPVVLQDQLGRMLADERGEGVMWRFAESWLHLDRLANVSRSTEVYPDLTPQIRADMAGETERFLESLFASGGTVSDLFRSQDTWVTPRLATYYGLPSAGGAADADGFRKVNTAASPYGGLLAQGSLLTTFANPTDSSPVHRGVMVREQLLCDKLPPPPANLDISPPDVDPNATTRERFEQHRSDASCAGCHDLIDPVGYGFEAFDGAGRHRELENGLSLDLTGEVVDLDLADATFDGLDELGGLLADSSQVRTCYVQQWARYGLGGLDTNELACRLDHLDVAFQRAGGRLDDVLYALVSDAAFGHRVGTAGELDAPGYDQIAVPLDEQADRVPGDTGDTGSPVDTGWETIGDVYAVVDVVNDWGSGFCADVAVHNDGASEVAWAVSFAPGGQINNVWNAEMQAGGVNVTFVGVSWNQMVGAGSVQSFGYCATR